MKIDKAFILRALAALSQETRLDVFHLLVEYTPEGLAAGEIATRLKVAAPSLSFHLKELAAAGLVSSRQDGRFVWYSAKVEAMNGLVGYLTENCCAASRVCDAGCAPRRRTQMIPAKRRKAF